MITAINITAIIMSTIAVLVSLAALAMVIGIKLSSHKIEYRPLEIKDPFAPIGEEEVSLSEPSEELVKEALELSRKGKERKKKEEVDPLDSILESNNF